jgi:DNA-binding NtrC family response regulator
MEVRLDQPRKILVIEQDEVVVLLISHLLTRQSYIVHVSLDVREAALLLERERYDAILIEPKTPHGGAELIRSIASHSRELLSRVILVTSDPDHPLAHLPLHGVIRKPVEIANLIDTVRDCVKSSV